MTGIVTLVFEGDGVVAVMINCPGERQKSSKQEQSGNRVLVEIISAFSQAH